MQFSQKCNSNTIIKLQGELRLYHYAEKKQLLNDLNILHLPERLWQPSEGHVPVGHSLAGQRSSLVVSPTSLPSSSGGAPWWK